MKEYKLNLDDIEEVESTPRRRRHNHQMNNNRNDNYKSISVPYEQQHVHHHQYNNNINELNKGIPRNFDENQHNNRQHRHRPRPPHWSEFGCKQILLMTIFAISILVLFIAFFKYFHNIFISKNMFQSTFLRTIFNRFSPDNSLFEIIQ